MRGSFAFKVLLLGAVTLACAGFSGCGGSEPTPESPENVKATQQLDQERMKVMEEQYKNKKNTPAQ